MDMKRDLRLQLARWFTAALGTALLVVFALWMGTRSRATPAPQPPVAIPPAAPTQPAPPVDQQAVADALAELDAMDRAYAQVRKLVESRQPHATTRVESWLADTRRRAAKANRYFDKQGGSAISGATWFRHHKNGVSAYSQAAECLKGYLDTKRPDYLTQAAGYRQEGQASRNGVAQFAR